MDRLLFQKLSRHTANSIKTRFPKHDSYDKTALMFILQVTANDQPGIVAAVANTLSQSNCNIEESAQFHDPLSNKFFMRVVFAPLKDQAEKTFEQNFTKAAQKFTINWTITEKNKPIKTLILVSKEDHCLNDLLYRWKKGAINIDVTAIASNHETARDLAKANNLPFHYLPITPQTKAEQETQIRNLITETGSELILMARYMQILSNQFCNNYTGRIINIHHSFLPGFKGAKPYHQAYERGVKIIGATAHFATTDLDEGPIIAQNILPIDHSYNPKKLQSIGRDGEARTLAKATDLYCQRRIFLHENRTVIL